VAVKVAHLLGSQVLDHGTGAKHLATVGQLFKGEFGGVLKGAATGVVMRSPNFFQDHMPFPLKSIIRNGGVHYHVNL
jgi:hypothetical protein